MPSDHRSPSPSSASSHPTSSHGPSVIRAHAPPRPVNAPHLRIYCSQSTGKALATHASCDRRPFAHDVRTACRQMAYTGCIERPHTLRPHGATCTGDERCPTCLFSASSSQSVCSPQSECQFCRGRPGASSTALLRAGSMDDTRSQRAWNRTNPFAGALYMLVAAAWMARGESVSGQVHRWLD